MPSKKLWAYISRLERAIKDTMESSPEIAKLVEKIQAEGVEVSLNCIALFSDPNGRTFTSPAGKIVKRAKGPAAAPPEVPRANPVRKKPGRRPKGRPASPGPAGNAAAPTPKLDISEKDREFLRSIGIRFD